MESFGSWGSGALWGWLMWTSFAMLFVPVLILTVRLEIEDIKNSKERSANPRTPEEQKRDSEHQTAA